ncbi:Potassium channel subfamily K member [Seminavis robusta]|uniref:Potassium channel subfamily K member n=1 Tax=Seminavis robusta TaxID=568900 RepID=A0A9N8H8B9_9STRA|nr:Potassium channel subfamily K member [Seminavis robusta]|eukprot:Sro164_g073610.1 Potassium channel subfamily K member (549) ;mRNA; f:49055-50879
MVFIFKEVGEHNTSSVFYEVDHSGKNSQPQDGDSDLHGNRSDHNQNSSKSEQAHHVLDDDDDEYHQDDELSPSYKEIVASSFWVHKLQHRCPRLFYITTELVIPLLILIGMSFLFGWCLAKFEMVGEIEANDQSIGENLFLYIFHSLERISLWVGMGDAASQCLGSLTENHENMTVLEQSFPNLNESMFDCAVNEGSTKFVPLEPIDFLVGGGVSLTFDWMTCPDNIEHDESSNNQTGFLNFSEPVFERLGLNPKDQHDRQFLAYIINFYDDFQKVVEQSDYSPEEVLFDFGLLLNFTKEATGSKDCKVHLAGGALFWFTIMTTIGYGNTAPSTNEGRLLVYTCGFLTILGFVALNNTAANVWKNLIEDAFLRLNWKRLVHGPICVLFWLCTTILWMLVLALSIQKYRRNRIGDDFPLSDAYWFSYITTTTVGFGDIHISHEEFKVVDMFFVPLLVLMGFNFLGIFAEKLVDLYNEWFPAKSGFGKILAVQRGRRHRQNMDTSSPRRNNRVDANGKSHQVRSSKERSVHFDELSTRERPREPLVEIDC